MNRHILSVTALLVAASAAGRQGQAEAARRNPLEGQPAIRHRLELRKLRFEATPFAGFTMLQDFNNTILGGAKLGFHVFDWLSINGIFAGGTAVGTGLKDTVLQTLRAPGGGCGAVGPGPIMDVCLAEQAMNYIAWFGAAEAELRPFGGKFSLFGKGFFHYDLYFGMGMAFVGLKNKLPQQPADCSGSAVNQFGCNQGMKIGPTGAIGLQMFFNDWIALNLEYRFIYIKDNQAGRDTNRDRTVNDNDLKYDGKSVITVGAAIFFPTTAAISK
jgi:outer membrane beta-barrel protein